MNPRLELDRIIDDRRTRIIVCCGSGGVGKTTTAASIGLRAAERGRLIRVLTAPVKAGRPFGRVLNAGLSVMTGALTRLLGAQVLRDAQTFITAFDTMFGGFRERAEATYRLLQAPGTSFLVVAAPEPDALREASYFVERLDEERMPLAGLILNRVHRSPAVGLSAARSLAAAETLDGEHAVASAAL